MEPQTTAPGTLLADFDYKDELPPHVQRLLSLVGKQDDRIVLFMLTYIVAVETGFISTTEYAELQNELEDLPHISTYHSGNALKICSRPPTYSLTDTCYIMHLLSLCGEANSTNKFQLTALYCANNLVITLTPPAAYERQGFSSLLQQNKYIKAEPCPNILGRLQNMRELSQQLRDEVFRPACILHMHFSGIPSYPALGGLPEMVAKFIIDYLHADDIKTLSHTNQRLLNAVRWSRGEEYFTKLVK